MTLPPNILLVLPDQLRADFAGFNAQVPVRTPHLHSLAARGTRFTHAVTPSPLCAPARACLATGMDYPRCGVPGNQVDLPLNASTFYQLLRNAGYWVMGCGKFDLAKQAMGWKLDGSSRLSEWGFCAGMDCEGKWDAVGSARQQPRGPYMAMLQARGLREIHIADMDHRWNAGNAATFATPLPDDAYADNWVGRQAVDLLRAAPPHQPWFLQVNFPGPHDPWDITESMEHSVGNLSFPLPAGPNATGRDLSPELHQAVRRNYSVMIENIDRWLGEMLRAKAESPAESHGMAANTVVVFASDHGEMLGDRGLWGKAVAWAPSVNIPLVIAGPGIQHGLIEPPVSLLDLPATFLELAKIPVPAHWDSRSLLGALGGANTSAMREFVTSAVGNWRMVQNRRHKLIVGSEGVYLFDLVADSAEQDNLAAGEPGLVQHLCAQLEGAWASKFLKG